MLTLIAIFVFTNLIFIPIRLQSCKNVTHAAEIIQKDYLVRARDIMCSPGKLLGFFDMYRTINNIFDDI